MFTVVLTVMRVIEAELIPTRVENDLGCECATADLSDTDHVVIARSCRGGNGDSCAHVARYISSSCPK